MDRDESRLHVAQIVPGTEAEGPGRRFALWLQGCPLRCPGCCNPEMLPFEGGRIIDVEDLAGQVLRAEGVEGITLLGGEPLAQAAGAAALARRVQRGGTVGHGLQRLHPGGDPGPEQPGRTRPAGGDRYPGRWPLSPRLARDPAALDRLGQPAHPLPDRPLSRRGPVLATPEHAGGAARRGRRDGQRLPGRVGRRSLAAGGCREAPGAEGRP